ncbi:hypothetical protein BBJ28_00000847 [Nothophytophthora sp. Chile5]|nr:hypothetical protein BBJ28_00000847 [Nothophytophthora sp. Chile5]
MEAIPQAADTMTVVNADSPKDVRLEANLAIPDGGELVLSIQVPHEAVKLHSHGPAKVTRVYSDHADGKYGVGEVIHIFVEFTSAVQIVGKGAPWLLLHTGCHDSSCHVREVQRLRCQATKGKFALAFDGQKVGNVPWDATQKVLAAYIQRMTKIGEVSVEYSIDEDRACTFFGNNITITYESMNVAGNDGDLSEMTGDSNNLVGDGVVLEHIQYPPGITSTAWELQKGVLIPDRRAQFVSQTTPNTLQFAYTVQKGDNTSRLEYANSDSLALSLRAAGGARILNADGPQIPVNAILPPPGFAGDWERGLGTSLSTHNALTINVAPPYVTTVTSPHVDGTFGIGEEILVHVRFSQPIVVSGLPTVVLETGTVDRIIPFSQVVMPEGTIAEFRYIVQSMDTSPDLTYTSTDALQLNGGSIKRQSTTPTTTAILKLPANGESGSLSVNKNIVIDTTNPQIQSVTTIAADGTYTAGDEIPIIITFDMPVVVTGTPQLLLNTGTIDLFPGEFVQAAPTLSSTKAVIFPPVDHGLTTQLSRGLQFRIDGQILTVDYVNGDEVTMLEDYTGTVVDPRDVVGWANIQIKTPGYRPANYNSGSGTASLVFVYAVQVGDVSTRLDYVSTAALQVGSGSIKRLSSTPFMDADVTLDAPGAVSSLGFGSSIVINTDAPVVSRVAAISRDGVYKADDNIDFEVEFNLAVVVFPTASVLTNVGTSGIERFAVYTKGSGSKNLKFRFQCIAADDAAVFDYVDVKALRASYGSSSGWIRRKSASPLVPAVLDLPAIGLSSKLISIRQGCAAVADVFTTHESGTFGVGEIRVKSFDFQQFPPLSSFEDGGGSSSILSFPLGLDASAPNLVVFASKLYLLWEEANSATNNPTQIRVAVLSSRANGGSAAQWMIVDNTPIDSSGINKVPTENAAAPHGVAHNSKLYTAWHENAGGIPQIRVAVYNGLDVTPGWTFVDGNQLARGLNYDASKSAGKVRLCSCASRLYAAWEEAAAATAKSQIRVAVQTGTDTSPNWRFIDGNGVTGLNTNTLAAANAPSIACLGGTAVVVAWHEATTGIGSIIWAKKFSGNLTSPMWTQLDSGSGLNYDATQVAKNVRLSVQSLGTTDILYATWDEVDATSSFSQIRVAKFTLAGAITSWKFLDGNAPLSSVNEDVTHAASRPMLTFGQSPDAIFAFWQENHSIGKTHVRGSMLESSVWEWQPISQACILRRSTSSVAAANLLLPEVNTPGSLDFDHSIRVETSVPVVESVSLIGEMESAVTSANTIQTIDVLNTGSLTQGEYKLIYGHLSETSCIDWDAPATGMGSVESALNSIVGLALAVSVVKDASAFLDGHRYTITFAFPSMGLQSLQPKRVPDASCKAFVCLPTAILPCNTGLVQTNQNVDVRVGVGIVDTVAHFSFPVEVQLGIPKLTLDAGTADRDAVYSTRSALQEFDVGVDSASPLLAGAFRLSYGDFSNGVGVGTITTTDCIQILPNDEDGVQEMQAKLEAIAVLNTIGIRSVSRREVRNGYRYGVEFRNSGDLLDLVPADSTACPAVSGRTQTIDISANSKILAGEIMVQLGDATSSCISWDLQAKGSINSMEAFLSSMDNDRTIPLQITKDPSAFAYGVKYYVSFMMRDDAKQPLIVSSDAACVAFTCGDGNGAPTTCSGLSIAANADFRVSRAASEALSFRYIVQSSDETASLTYKNSLSLTGSIVRTSMSPTVAALLTLPQPRDALLSESRAIPVSIVSINTIPVVARVSSTTLDDTYTAGDVILVLVEFSGTVEVNGKPILELDSNGKAFFVSGGGTDVLKFYYKVEAGDTSSDLNYASEAALRTFTTPESRIRCGLCSNLLIDANLALPSLSSVSSLSANSALIIDTTIPTIVEISSSRPDTVAGDASYGPGDIVDIIVEFSADVVVSGIPTLSLNSGGTATFTYAGYRQLIDVGVNAVAPVTSGQFLIVYNGEDSGCIDFDDADSSASTSLKSRLLEFPAIARIGVTSVTLTRKKNGNRFVILFDSTKVVDVPMAIELTLSDVCEPLYPSSTAPELLVSRSTDGFVVFHYTVEVGETAALLNVTGTAISLAGGDNSIKRRAASPTLNADLTLPDPAGPHGLAQTKTLAIDGAEITVLDIVSDSTAQTYGIAFPSTASPPTVGPGEVLFHLVFSRAVAVIGSPTVELATGSLRPNGEFIPNRFAKFAGQPQPDHVAFLYHVEGEDHSSNLAFASRNGLADAEIYCVASTMAVRATTLLPRLTVSDNAIIEIDAYSVPTTVKLASNQGDGVYGAGELIEIQVTFSKQVVLLTGLNHNLDWHARYPIALEFQNWIYIMWTERDDLHTPTKSYLYMQVFTSDTLDVVSMVSTSPINSSPDTFIEKVTATIWLGDIYAAWDEGGLLYCARFEGVTSPFPWTLIPNMGVNKDMKMAASDSVLIVYNLELVMIWRELAVPNGGANPVGHIHVAVRNDDNDAPLWIFHDGNQLQSGLNKDALMDADDPTAVVYRGRLYVSWSEMNEAGAYEIVIARRNMQTRDFSTWTYLEALPSTYPAYNFLSAYYPQLVVRRKGLEDMALLISWYRDTTISNFSEVITGQVLDLDWEASVTGSIPQTINAAESNSSIAGVSPNTKQQQFLTCGDRVYASWLGLEGASSEESAYVVKLATLPSGSDVYTGWTAAGAQYNQNQNPKFDAMDSFLVCSSSTSANPQVGLVWTEYDGYSMKLRLRHSLIVPRIPGISANSFGEIITGAPILLLATQSNPTGFAACVNMSGLTAYTLTFAYVVQPGESTPSLEILGSDALRLNGGEIRDIYGQTPDFTLFPDSTDLRSLAYNNQLIIDTTPPTVSGVTTVNPSGEYGVGELFLLQVAFTYAVTVFEGDLANIPTLHLRSDELHQMADSQGLAIYTGGSGTNVLTFEYTTTQQDYCERFDYLDSGSLSLNGEGWSVKRKSTRPIVDAILTLPVPKSTNSLSGNRLIAIKPTQPRVLSVSSSTPDGVYYPGDTILVDVVFSLPVVVFGSPVLLLATGDEGTQAFLTSGNESSTLTFQYDVKEGDLSAHLEVVDDRHGNGQVYFVMSLKLAGSSEIKRVSTNPYTSAILALPAPGLAGSLSINKNLVVDSTPPAVLGIRSPVLDGTYDVGETIDILVKFSRRVVVIGTPELILNVPALATRTAVYIDGSETDTLRFSYTPEEGDNSMNVALDFQNEYSLILRPLLDGMKFLQAPAQIIGLSASPVLAADLMLPLPGVAVRADAVLSLVGNNQKIFVRTDGFRVQGVEADVPNGVYSPGQRIVISVLFTGPAVVQGVPQIKLNANALSFATYIGGTGTARLQFEYIVVTGDSCSVLEAASRSALKLNGGVISDSNGIYAPLRLGAPLLPGSLSYKYRLEISSTPPIVERVYCQNGGVDALLETAVEPFATYIGGSGTATLRFTYTTREGDMALPLMYAGIDALSMVSEGAQVTAAATGQSNFRFATLRLPAPGATGSFSNNRDIHIDTLEPPRVLSVGSPMPDRIYTAGDTLELSVVFSMPVTVIGPAPTLLLQTGNVESSDDEKKAVYVSGSGTSVLLFEYEIQVGDRTDRLDYRPCPFSERRVPERREWDKLVICSSAANALQLEGTSGSVKRTSTFPTTDAVLDLPEVTDWAQVRFQTSHDEVVYVTQLEPTTDIPEADRTLSQPLVNEFTMTQQWTATTMYSNGIPDHKTTLLERLKEQRYFIELQRFPTQQSNPLVLSEVPDKFTGIFLNGIPFKSLSSSEQATDDCGGAIDADNRYFYVTLPVCYLAMAHEPREAPDSSQVSTSNPRPPSIIVAYALDGFPIYGFYNEDGELPSDLDECNGRVRRDGQYGYHLVPPDTPSASPFMLCLKGIDATSASQDQLEVFRYPADVAAVEGLSLSKLSRFDGLMIDESSTAEHATTWLNPDGVSVVYTSTSVIVRSTGVPPTGSYGPFPNAYNRFAVSEQDYVFQFPRHPMVSATTPLPLDAPIGVMLNGVPFFASDSDIYGGNVLDSANPAYVLMDRCSGLVDAGGDYRYYASPDCLLDQLGDVADQPSPLLGFAFDGFPLYGPYDENGQIPDDLDVCNGRTGDDGTYRYYVTLTSPYLLGCFRGEPLTDETGDLYRSLSYAHALRINTDRPRVAHVFTNKRPGTYVAGESVDVVVEWSTPVEIDWAGGLPSLEIQNSSRAAIYDPSRSSATSSSFMLTVTSGDFDIEDFSYDPHVPIELNGARISRLAALPVLDADLKLVPIDLDDTNLIRTGTSGLASKFQLVRSLRVELRGMYHPRATDLRARVFHGRRQSIIFDGCCAPRDAFGIPDVPDVLINRAQLGSEPRNPTSGVGWDYSFADLDGLDNLALDGGATALQSSTSGTCVASNAIDGRIRGVGLATQTVARTHPAEDEQESAWWELRLLESHPIGTIRVWIPERNPELPAIVLTLHVDASDGVSLVTGHFTLIFTTSNAQQQINTEPISHNAVAMAVDENPRATTPGIGLGESLQTKLSALGELMPRLFVTRDPRDAAMSDNGAFTWHITFLDNTGIASSVLSVGVNAVCDGTGVVELTVPSPIDDGSDPVMYRDEEADTPTNSTGQKASEQSMFPFWVLLFEHSAVMDIESFADAYDRAVFAYRVDGSQTNRSVIAVVPPAGTVAQYVRLVAELPRGILSLAEVEVFAEQTHVLSQYGGGTPVRPAYYPGAKMWSPEEPFEFVFGGMPSEGTWTLVIADMAANGSMDLKANATAGGISDWTLHVTNEAGETRAYFMDFQAQLHALPRHGTLYVALDGTERDHLDVDANGLLDSMEADVYLSRYSPTGYSALPALTRKRELQQFLLNYEAFGGVEVLRDPSERQKRLPSRVCDPACLQALGVDPYFYVGLEGDVALKLLRVVGDRVVKYVPQPGFRGKDAFTFSVAVGGQESRVLGTIQLTVEECEDPDCRMASFFLHRSTR